MKLSLYVTLISRNVNHEKHLLLFRKSVIEQINLPTKTVDELSCVHQKCEKAAIAYFINAAIFDSECKFQEMMKVSEKMNSSQGKIHLSKMKENQLL